MCAKSYPVVLLPSFGTHRLPLVFLRLRQRGTIPGTGEIMRERDTLETLWNMACNRSRRLSKLKILPSPVLKATQSNSTIPKLFLLAYHWRGSLSSFIALSIHLIAALPRRNVPFISRNKTRSNHRGRVPGSTETNAVIKPKVWAI